MVSKKTLNTLLASAVAVTVAGGVVADAHAAGKEKCYGVVKAGKNDCGSASKSHSCAGLAEADAGADEWITVPEGLCEKLAGGSLEPVMAGAEEHGDDHHMDEEH